jgi:Bacterial self-protective colicin-like immunity
MSFDNTTTERMVAKYKDLISKFVNRQVSAQNFESAYLMVFKTDKDQVPSSEFDVLVKLFFAVDDYVADPNCVRRWAA